ncbi:MAG: O-antigen ligase [Parcubacteria bacterium C7867-008]|nr:MAG: O-antigen ligase [Parcubacteria bacterium C7867-008]
MKKVALWTTLLALFAIPFLALYVDGTIYFPFIAGKNFGFRILVEIATASWIVLAIMDKHYRPKFSWVMVLFALFTAWMAIADFLAVNPHKAFWSNFERMDGWVTLIHLFLFFIVAGTVFGVDKLWRKWWLTFSGASALVCAYAALQFFGGAQIHQGSTRLDASLGNSEYLAGYLLFAIATTLWLAFDTKGKSSALLRYSLFILAAVQVLVLIGTGTRGTMVGFLAAAVAGTFLWLIEAGKRGKQGAAVALITILVVIGGFIALKEQPVIADNAILSRFASISLKDMEVRFTIWNMAMKGFEERPITGWGHEGFNYVFNKYYDPSLYGQEPWFDRVHNLYLDWLIAGGIPALVLFLSLFGAAIIALYRGAASRPERILVMSAFIAYGVQALVVFDNLFTYIPLAALFALAYSARSKPIPTLERLPEASETTASTIVTPVAFVVLVLVLWMVNVPTIQGGKDLIQGLTPTSDVNTRFASMKRAVSDNPFAIQEVREQLMSFTSSVVSAQEIPNNVKQEVLVFANEQMALQFKQAPGDARVRIQYAIMLRSVGDYQNAIKQSDLARSLAPTKQTIILEQGMERWQSGDVVGGRKFFEEAYALDRRYELGAVYAAVGHIITNDVAGGQAILKEKFGTTLVDQQILVPAYYQLKDWNNIIPLIQLHVKNAKDAGSGFQLAAAYSESGQRDKAIQTIRETIAAHPEAAAQGNSFLAQLGAQ